MKIVEIDIDQTYSPKDLEVEFGNQDLQKGDRLHLLFSEPSNSDFAALSIVLIVLLVIRQRFKDYADNLLKEVFKNQTVEDIERELRNIYGIELVIDSKEDDERRQWQKFSQTSLVKAYAFDEPDYTENMVKEPNPDYKK